jgi:hypothetical protein
MATGDLRPLLELPMRTKVAFLQRRKAVVGEEQAKTAGEDWVRLFGDRLAEADAKRVREAFMNWELGRGEAAAYGLLQGPETNLVFRSDVADAGAFERGARGLLALVNVPSVAAPITHFVGRPSLRESTVRLPELARPVARTELTLTPKAGGTPTRLDFLWLAETTAAFGVAGKDPKASFGELLAAAKGKAPNLAADAEVSAMAGRLGAQATLALFMDAGRLWSAGPDTEKMPVLLAVGKDPAFTWAKLDVSRPALSLLIRASVAALRQ